VKAAWWSVCDLSKVLVNFFRHLCRIVIEHPIVSYSWIIRRLITCAMSEYIIESEARMHSQLLVVIKTDAIVLFTYCINLRVTENFSPNFVTKVIGVGLYAGRAKRCICVGGDDERRLQS